MTDLQYKKEAYDWVHDRWLHALDPYEQSVVYYLLRESIGYGLKSRGLGFIQMQRGTVDRNNNQRWYKPPIGMSVNKLRSVLSELEKKGAVKIVPGDSVTPNTYTLNMDWRPAMPPLPIPKRLRQDRPKTMFDTEEPSMDGAVNHSEPHSTPCHTPTSRGAIPHSTGRQYIEESKEELKEELRSPLRADGGLKIEKSEMTAEAFAAVKTRSRENLKPVAPTREKLWNEALRETFPEAPLARWLIQEKGAVNTMAKRWDDPKVPFDQFLDFVVRNWRAIIREHFLPWMTNSPPPELPNVMFMSKGSFYSKFLEAFRMKKLKPEDDFDRSRAAEVRRLVLTGMTEEDATAEFWKQQGRSEERSRQEKNKQYVATETMAAELRRDAEIDAEIARRRAIRESAAKAPLTDAELGGAASDGGRNLLEAPADADTYDWGKRDGK